MKTAIWQVDAFSSEPFRGNPAAVCLLDDPADSGWMQKVATEMNLSETAFVVPSGEVGRYGLRWFTPGTEVALCGHATLATSHVLWNEVGVDAGVALAFETLSGELRASRDGDVIQLDFPARPPTEAVAPQGLLEALGVSEARFVGRDSEDILVLLDDEQAVRRLEPDLAALGDVNARGIIVTARADDPEISFVSRFFAPAVGVPEDPVTGSAHCCLAPFWSARLGTSEHRAYQASRRGGFVNLRVKGDRVLLGGHAVTVFRGELIV